MLEGMVRLVRLYQIVQSENNQMDMFIKKGKLCDISKFAKNWFLYIDKVQYVAVQPKKITG